MKTDIMNNEICIHGGVLPVGVLVNLHYSQAGSGRHRCPTCAYEQGFLFGSSKIWKSYQEFSETITDGEKCQIGNIAPANILRILGDNQGGTGRHKCTNCAFKQGFEVGISNVAFDEINLELVSTPTNVRLKDSELKTTGSKVDYIAKEIKNKQLGDLGELFILKNEIKILKDAGRDDLVSKIIHISKEQGDGIRYDILSFDLNGKEKRIEVKTTRGNKTRPFYVTKNEIVCSIKNEETYYLYRLFDFDTQLNRGKYYEIKGNLKNLLLLEAILFLALPNN